MSTHEATMRAAVIHEPGGPEVLRLEEVPLPSPEEGQVLIRVKAFGLNRSELFTRRGLSPTVQFPRVLGIEAVGVVENAPGGEFTPGDVVATAMGGMGREFDGRVCGVHVGAGDAGSEALDPTGLGNPGGHS